MQYNINIKLIVNTPSLQQMEINIRLSFNAGTKSESVTSSGSVFKVIVELETKEHKNMASIILCIGIVSSHS